MPALHLLLYAIACLAAFSPAAVVAQRSFPNVAAFPAAPGSLLAAQGKLSPATSALRTAPLQMPQGQNTSPALQGREVSLYRGQAVFNGLPVPGAKVTAAQGGKEFVTITDRQGRYSFPDLVDGTWTIEIEMTGFATIKQNVVVAPNTPPEKWELKLLPLAEINAVKRVVGSAELSSNSAVRSSVPGKSRRPAKNAGLRYPPNAGSPKGNKSPRRGKTLAVATPAIEGAPSGPNAKTPAGKSHKPAKSAGPRYPLSPEAGASEGELSQLASPGFLINGSVNNGAASPFAQLPAFGNHRNNGNGLYRFGIGAILDNSSLDAAPFSLSGQKTPKPVYNRISGIATFGGPLKIPHLLQNGPTVFAGYEWTRSLNDTTASALVPGLAEREGDFFQVLNAQGQPVQIVDPATGLPFPGNTIPQSRISPQARALLNFYPRPNFSGNPRYNYQVPINSNTHQEALQSRVGQTIGQKDELYGGFSFQSTQTAAPNLFGFLDTTHLLGINTGINWSHRLNQGMYLNLGYRFSRLATQTTPYFENRENVSGQAGISGNNQDPMNWGPPALAFASGIAGLSDALASDDHDQTSALSSSLLWVLGLHNITFGGDFRRQQFNYLSQQDPRGTFTFTGGTTGFDFADFLLGIPDTSSIAFGNADKYFRESVYDAYIDDDYRIRPDFTLDGGVRWEYSAPITELYDRLVNLDIVPRFAAVSPVLASDPLGPLTGQRYPSSLIRPDKTGFEPRVGIAWRPVAGSSMVVRAGYGIYDNTSVYQTIALQMAQQAPLSKSLRVQNSPACPLTLANGFNTCPSITPNTFAIDPNFQVGYAQDWNLELQRDLPGSLQLTATYLGTKGTRGLQEFLPNTYPPGAVNPCPACPAGFAYFASNGNSTREAVHLQLRRRLESGLAATLQYTYSKAIDDDSLLGGQGAATVQSTTVLPWLRSGAAASSGTMQGAPTVAQNWRDLAAERSLSAFDQRHLLNATLQYTTGMGLGGGTLLSGWKAALFKEWTFLTVISLGSGLPETPIYLAPAPGTGVTGSIRPYYTGAPLYAAPSGLFLNPAAYVAPMPGQWGNAGRYSIVGPTQFSLDASIGRTFRLHGRYNLDLRIDSTNALNHVNFINWNTTINGVQFGLPAAASPMRSLQTTLRLRF